MTGDEELLATLTHAKLRAAQGDVAGACRILERRLASDPGDGEARRLLALLNGDEWVEPDQEPRGRIVRLRAWLSRAGKESGMGEMVSQRQGLDESLEQVHDLVEGIRSVFLVGMDGMIAAGSSTSDNAAWEWVAATYTELLRKAAATNREADLAAPTELLISTADSHFIFRVLTDEYGLLAVLDSSSGSLGRARFELRRAASQILPELL